MLVGFPGETQKDFDELCQFVQDYPFDRLGVFTYSHEEDTSAYTLADAVPATVKLARQNQLMALQRTISHEKNLRLIGQTVRVMIDRKEKAGFTGRSEADSPEVDQEIHIMHSKQRLMPGDFVMVRITEAEDYDLIGEIVPDRHS